MNVAADHREFWRSRLDLPNYGVGDAARYAKVHAATVGRWHKNTTLGAREAGTQLSYLQLIELAVVAACKEAGMKLVDIRVARAYFSAAFNDPHPFATLRLKTDGVDLAMQAGADLLIGNRNGQLAWNDIIGQRFQEFEYEGGLAVRWHLAGPDSVVVVDPRVTFGAPSVAGVPTWALKGRWDAGEELAEIADDFNLQLSDIEQALAFEGVNANSRRKKQTFQ